MRNDDSTDLESSGSLSCLITRIGRQSGWFVLWVVSQIRSVESAKTLGSDAHGHASPLSLKSRHNCPKDSKSCHVQYLSIDCGPSRDWYLIPSHRIVVCAAAVHIDKSGLSN